MLASYSSKTRKTIREDFFQGAREDSHGGGGGAGIMWAVSNLTFILQESLSTGSGSQIIIMLHQTKFPGYLPTNSSSEKIISSSDRSYLVLMCI